MSITKQKRKGNNMQSDDGTMVRLDAEMLAHEKRAGNEDIIFSIGEYVKVKGGEFKVKSFGKKMMVLEGLPGTRVKR